MRFPARRRAPACSLAIAIALTPVVLCAQATEEGPTYVQSLRMPHRNDGFKQPRAVVADLHANEIFVCDSLNHRIVIFGQDGRLRYQIPGGTTFRAPIDLAVDPEGRILVLDAFGSHNGFHLLDFDGEFLERIVLSNLPEGIESPQISSIAFSHSGDRIVALDEANHRLWFAARTGSIQTSVDLTAGRSQEEIKNLRYGRVDVYADTALLPIPTDGLVHRFNLEGQHLGTIGAKGLSECETMFPVAAALDDRGNMIILDRQRAMFMIWDVGTGNCLSEHYGFGNAPGYFYQPGDLALDAAGRIYVAQGFEGRVQRYDGANPAASPLPTVDVP